MLSLDSLGTRIVILGPSNAGKSTLAVALARKLDIEAIHLDRFQHLPNTDWQVRPEAEFARLHDEAIWILFTTRNGATKYAEILRHSGLPTVECHTAKALDALYRQWELPSVR